MRPNTDGNCWSKKWDWTKKQIFELNSGRAISLELDPDHSSVRNSGVVPARTSNDSVVVAKKVKNLVFLIND